MRYPPLLSILLDSSRCHIDNVYPVSVPLGDKVFLSKDDRGWNQRNLLRTKRFLEISQRTRVYLLEDKRTNHTCTRPTRHTHVGRYSSRWRAQEVANNFSGGGRKGRTTSGLWSFLQYKQVLFGISNYFSAFEFDYSPPLKLYHPLLPQQWNPQGSSIQGIVAKHLNTLHATAKDCNWNRMRPISQYRNIGMHFKCTPSKLLVQWRMRTGSYWMRQLV